MVTSVAIRPEINLQRRTHTTNKKIQVCRRVLEKMMEDKLMPQITLSRGERFSTVKNRFLEAAKELNIRIYFSTVRFGTVRPAGYIQEITRVEPREFVISY